MSDEKELEILLNGNGKKINNWSAYYESTKDTDNRKLVGFKISNLSARDYTKINYLLYGLCRFENLTSLDLSGNHLTVLPETISEMNQLKKIWLNGNQLTSLPKSLDKLAELDMLNISNNKIEILPELIGNFHNLESLELSCNLLSFLPESFGDLDGLKKLYLNDNNLESLPESFNCLNALETLDLSRNKIVELWNGKLTNINNLSLADNPITSLTDYDYMRISDKIKSIDLSYTKIKIIPEWIGNLKYLDRLNLSGLQLLILPYSLMTNDPKKEFHLNSQFSLEYGKGVYLRNTLISTMGAWTFEQDVDQLKKWYKDNKYYIENNNITLNNCIVNYSQIGNGNNQYN